MADARNQLIERLPRRDRNRLLEACKSVDLEFEQVLWHQALPARHAYFPTSSFISVVASLDAKPVLEIGMVGREGILGAQLVLGATISPVHAVVQGGGTALCITAAALRSQADDSARLRRLIDSYLSVLMSQLGTSAVCVRFHQIGPRLARWLLMTQDRSQSESFHVTHQFLSYMLGVRRVGVTAAAGRLQDRGLISYSRGRISVLDRGGLEKASCSCYAADQACYHQAFG